MDADNSWVRFDSSQSPLSNSEFSHDDNRVIIPANKVTTYDITICLVSKEKTPPEPEESTITIDGIPSETVQGVVGTSGFLNVTIWLNTKDERTDITNDAEIVFNSSISSSLSYNKQYGQIVWGNDITSGIYNISLTATYDNITSVQYPLILSINSRTPEILLYGTQDSYVSKVNTPGATGKITAMYVDSDKPIMEDITSEVDVNIQSPDLASCGFSWDSTGYVRWNPTKTCSATCTVVFQSAGPAMPRTWIFTLNVTQ